MNLKQYKKLNTVRIDALPEAFVLLLITDLKEV
jgi:hypothetical protein